MSRVGGKSTVITAGGRRKVRTTWDSGAEMVRGPAGEQGRVAAGERLVQSLWFFFSLFLFGVIFSQSSLNSCLAEYAKTDSNQQGSRVSHWVVICNMYRSKNTMLTLMSCCSGNEDRKLKLDAQTNGSLTLAWSRVHSTRKQVFWQSLL